MTSDAAVAFLRPFVRQDPSLHDVGCRKNRHKDRRRNRTAERCDRGAAPSEVVGAA